MIRKANLFTENLIKHEQNDIIKQKIDLKQKTIQFMIK